jgi:hypothetical protein
MTDSYEECTPDPEATIESIRSLGYDLNIAISDLIDNSITARAKNIWFIHKWDAEKSFISIYDDGNGMDEVELFKAMKLGSSSPLIERDSKDLGRFGLGLKVASWSLCRILTVATKKKKGDLNIRKWDLDYVSEKNRWLLKRETDQSSLKILEILLKNNQSGTVLLLQNLDRLLSLENDIEKSEAFFYDKIDILKKYLSMVFHRYLSGQNSIKIHVSNFDEVFKSGKNLKPWDPFLESNTNTKIKPTDVQKYKNHSISITPFILPHHSKFKTKNEFKEAGGLFGWNAHQGIFVYRQKRMIMYGGWMGFRKPEDHYKLARIRLDIPNSMDSDWKVGVKKVSVTPPDFFKDTLKRYVKITTEHAGKVYRFRGAIDKRGNTLIKEIIWKRYKARNGDVSYKIERKHPMVKKIIDKASNKRDLGVLLTLIEKTIPIESIIVSDREDPNSHLRGVNNSEDDNVPLKKWYDEHMKFLTRNNQMSYNEAFNNIITIEPFNLYINELEIFRGLESDE